MRPSVSRSWQRPRAGAIALPVGGSRSPEKAHKVKDRTEAFERLACEPGAPCRAHEDPTVTSSVLQATRARRAARHQEREDQAESEKERRTAGLSETLPRSALEELISAPLWPRHVFGKMPQTCRVANRNLMIELIWEFVNVDVDQPDAEPVQMQAYIDLHMLTHAVARRLYPRENGAGDMAADAGALRDRISKVKRSRHELVTLWQEAVAAADDETQRRSQSQRMAFDLEANKVKDIARAQAFAEQASYRRAVHALMACFWTDLRDPAVLALVRALNPDAERPAVRAPLDDLPSAPKIIMTALKKAARKMEVFSAAGLDGMPVLHVSGLMRSTAGDAGVDTSAKARLMFMQICENGDLTRVALCLGAAKHVFILKNAASGVAGGLRPLAVGTVF
jgi:hypothetical protein